ncbi:MAG: hypothetical protein NTU53_20045 [Planctomycetota bacterium]|nr:hypothetical protein [Planctomycetota bacterium]
MRPAIVTAVALSYYSCALCGCISPDEPVFVAPLGSAVEAVGLLGRSE